MGVDEISESGALAQQLQHRYYTFCVLPISYSVRAGDGGYNLPAMAITLRVYELLKAKGLTPYALAKQAKISQTLAYRVAKRGARFRRTDEETLEKLCLALKCDLADLLHWDGKHSPRRPRWRPNNRA
jgi:DNA-binding Xre family transcriptional regulator